MGCIVPICAYMHVCVFVCVEGAVASAVCKNSNLLNKWSVCVRTPCVSVTDDEGHISFPNSDFERSNTGSLQLYKVKHLFPMRTEAAVRFSSGSCDELQIINVSQLRLSSKQSTENSPHLPSVC